MMPVPIIIGSQLRQTLRNTKIRLFFILGSITIFGYVLSYTDHGFTIHLLGCGIDQKNAT